MFGLINRVDKVIWPPQRDASADVSSLLIIVPILTIIQEIPLKPETQLCKYTAS